MGTPLFTVGLKQQPLHHSQSLHTLPTISTAKLKKKTFGLMRLLGLALYCSCAGPSCTFRLSRVSKRLLPALSGMVSYACIAPRKLENVSTTALSLNSLFFEPIFRAKLDSKKISIEELHRFCHHGPLFPNPCNRNIVSAPSVDRVVATYVRFGFTLHSTVCDSLLLR